MRVTKRRTKLLYAPVFMMDYSHGELFNQFGERKAHRFCALMSGLAPQHIAAERHFSPQKVGHPCLPLASAACSGLVGCRAVERHFSPQQARAQGLGEAFWEPPDGRVPVSASSKCGTACSGPLGFRAAECQFSPQKVLHLCLPPTSAGLPVLFWSGLGLLSANLAPKRAETLSASGECRAVRACGVLIGSRAFERQFSPKKVGRLVGLQDGLWRSPCSDQGQPQVLAILKPGAGSGAPCMVTGITWDLGPHDSLRPNAHLSSERSRRDLGGSHHHTKLTRVRRAGAGLPAQTQSGHRRPPVMVRHPR